MVSRSLRLRWLPATVVLLTITLSMTACDYTLLKNPTDNGNPVGPSDTTNTGDTTTNRARPTLAVVPDSVTLQVGASQQFTVTSTGLSDTSMRWDILLGPGSIDASGRYTAPATITSDTSQVQIRATSLEDTTVMAFAYIAVWHPIDTSGSGNDGICFQRDVLPIFLGNCAVSGCHDPLRREEGRDYSSYAGITARSSDIRAGQPSRSKIYQVISGAGEAEEQMPPRDRNQLSAMQIAIIRQWIEEGATNGPCGEPTGCDTSNVTYSGTIQPILATSCLGCHAGSYPDGGINLQTYANVRTVALSGRLYNSVAHAPGAVAMPQNGDKLPDCQVSQIRIWVEAGAPNN